MNIDNLKDIISEEVYKDIVDENYRHALAAVAAIIQREYKYEDANNPYTEIEKQFMSAVAFKCETIIWVLVTVGNKAYGDINKSAVSFERWFNVAYMLLLPIISYTIGHMAGYDAGYEYAKTGNLDALLERYKCIDKEFTRVKLSHPVFDGLKFADTFIDLTQNKEKIDKNIERFDHVKNDPLIIDALSLIPKINEIIEKLVVDINYINEIELCNIVKGEIECTEEQLADPIWIDERIEEFGILFGSAENLCAFAKDFDLKGKLNLLGFINQLIFVLHSYSRRIIQKGVTYDHEFALNPLLRDFAELRDSLGIEIDEGGNYIGGEDTNKL